MSVLGRACGSRGLLWLLAAGMTLGTLAFVPDYGIAWDEWGLHRYGDLLIRFFASGFQDREALEFSDLYYYGGLFPLLAAWVGQIGPMDPYRASHYLNAVIGLLGVIATFQLGRRIGGVGTGLAAALLLLATPSWWGHQFNNLKDIPFAVFYAWALVFLVDYERQMRARWHLPLIGFALAWGLCLSVRVGGVLLVGPLIFAILLHTIADSRSRGAAPAGKTLLGHLPGLGGATLLAWAMMVAVWPWSWSNPLGQPLAALQRFRDFPWSQDVLFRGQQMPANELGWKYLPISLGIKLPELHLALLVVALLLALYAILVARTPMVAVTKPYRPIALVAFSAVFPLALIVGGVATDYDGIRHVLFILPPLCVLAGHALVRALRLARARSTAGHLLITTLVVAYGVHHVRVLIELHPYEYVYYNAFVGGLPGAYQRFETDYWGLSYAEAVSLLESHVATIAVDATPDHPIKVYTGSDPPSSTHFFPESFVWVAAAENPDYLIATTRWNCDETFLGPPLLVVERFGTPLAVIKEVREQEPRGACPKTHG